MAFATLDANGMVPVAQLPVNAAAVIRATTGAPSVLPADQNGDGAIDYATGRLYGPMASGAWPAPFLALLQPVGYLASGQYYFPQGCDSPSASATLGNGALRLTPWVIPNPVTLTRIGAECTIVGDAAAVFRLGIYNDTNGLPSSLVLDAGTISGFSNTVQELTISQLLNPGMYWIGGAVQGVTVTQPTMKTLTRVNVTAPLGSSTPGAAATSLGVSMSGVTGALGAFSLSGASGSMPRVFVKIA